MQRWTEHPTEGSYKQTTTTDGRVKFGTYVRDMTNQDYADRMPALSGVNQLNGDSRNF